MAIFHIRNHHFHQQHQSVINTNEKVNVLDLNKMVSVNSEMKSILNKGLRSRGLLVIVR